MVTIDQLKNFLDELSKTYSDNAAHLTNLDSAIGDADHGINMDRGFKAVEAALSGITPPDIGDLLKTVSMQLIKTVGGASGPLYGTFFLKASMAAGKLSELDAVQLLRVIEEGVAGVIARGKAEPGDKTMVDAWKPALEAMRKEQSSVKAMLAMGAEAAEEGMKATIPMLARKGRASYLGERSIGHQDPGATSTYLLLQTAAQCLG